MSRSTKDIIAIIWLSIAVIGLVVHFILVPASFIGFLIAVGLLGIGLLVCWAIAQLLGLNEPPEDHDDDDYDYYTSQW